LGGRIIHLATLRIAGAGIARGRDLHDRRGLL
jgi:hypothetical protein